MEDPIVKHTTIETKSNFAITEGAGDDDLFEIVDHTSASPFERFVNSIESILLETWKVGNGSLGLLSHSKQSSTTQPTSPSASSDHLLTELISYGDSVFELSYHCLPASFLTNDSSVIGFHSSAVKLDRKARERLGSSINDIKASSEFYVLPVQSTTPSLTGSVLDPRNTKAKERVISWHKLHRWAGLTHFIVLKPCRYLKTKQGDLERPQTIGQSELAESLNGTGENGDTLPSKQLYSADQIKPFDLDIHGSHLLISAVSVALSNTGCILPIFVQQGEAWKNVHKGICIGSRLYQDEEFSREIDTCFKMSHLPFIPPSHGNLASVLNIFVDRFANDLYSIVGKDVSKDAIPEYIYASISTTYVFRTSDTKQEALVLKGPLACTHTTTDSRVVLPLGQPKDPVSSLSLEMHYPLATASSYLNMAIDPVLAYAWHLSMSVDISPSSLTLSSILSRTLQVWAETFDPNHVMGRGLQAFAHTSGNYKDGGDRSAQLMRRLSVRENSPIRHLVDADDINNILVHMFSEAQVVPPVPPKRLSIPNSTPAPTVIVSQDLVAALSSKSLLVPFHSLLWKFALDLMDAASPTPHALHFDAGILAVLKGVWSDFMKELRWRWESGIYLPGVQIFAYRDGKIVDSDLYMDLSTPVLHQKLVMFNSCVYRKNRSRKLGSDPRDTSASTAWTMSSVNGRPASPRKRQAERHSVTAPPPVQDNDPGMKRQGSSGGTTNLLGTIAGVAGVASSVVGGGVDVLTKAATSQTSTLTSLLERVTPLRPSSPSKRPESPVPTSTTNQTPIISATSPSVVSEISPSGENTTLSTKPISVAIPAHPHTSALSSSFGFGTSWASERSWGAVSTSEARITPSDTQVPTISESVVTRAEPISFDGGVNGSPSPLSHQHVNGNTLGDSFVNISGDVVTPQGLNNIPEEKEGELNPVKDSKDRLGRVLDDEEQEGQKRVLEGLFLLKTGKPIWEPETQSMGLMTEDMIREYEAVLESLGSTPDGTKLRARLQSGQLISDMEAFKAANPYAILEDFVRWHSPRDCEILPDGTAQLSMRMLEPGNLWQELWQTARRIPAKNQKLLFDPEKEVSKVFDYLENVSPHDILSSLLPTMVIIAYGALSTHPVVKELPYVATVMNDLAQSINRLQWDITMTIHDTARMDDVIYNLKKAEAVLQTAISLLTKLSGSKGLVNRLLSSHTLAAKYEDPTGFLTSEEVTSLPYVHVGESERNAIRDCFCTITTTPIKAKPKRTGSASPDRKQNLMSQTQNGQSQQSSPLSTVMGNMYDAIVTPLSETASDAANAFNATMQQVSSRPGSPSLTKALSMENGQSAATTTGARNRSPSSGPGSNSGNHMTRSRTNSDMALTLSTISEAASSAMMSGKQMPTSTVASPAAQSPTVSIQYEWGYPDTREYILCSPPPSSNRMYIQLADGEFIILESNNV